MAPSDTVQRPGVRLQTRALTKRFAGADGQSVLALDRLDLVVDAGEFVAIIGPSGCGKSTFFHIAAGLEQPSDGEVLIDGQVVADRLGSCAFMPQRDTLLPWRRVMDNTTIALELHGMSRAQARERTLPLLQQFGLGDFVRSWPWQLSGGMRHRAAFLRTVVMNRPVMLLDEPFASLDGITRGDLQQWLLGVWEQVGSTVWSRTTSPRRCFSRTSSTSWRRARVGSTPASRSTCPGHAGWRSKSQTRSSSTRHTCARR